MKHPLIGELSAKIRTLMHELTVDIPAQLKFAVSLGDLSENAEYEMTKERQLFVESRIMQLEELLMKLQTINLDNIPNDRAAYGSRVTIEDLDNGEEKTFLLVFSGEDPSFREPNDILVTIGSPIALALTGKRVGDEIQVFLPKGSFDWEITGLVTFQKSI